MMSISAVIRYRYSIRRPLFSKINHSCVEVFEQNFSKSPALGLWPSPYLKSRFTWTHRIAWMLLSANTSNSKSEGVTRSAGNIFRLSPAALKVLPRVRYVRAWKMGMSPRKPWAKNPCGEDSSSQEIVGVWSCIAYIKEPHLPAMTQTDMLDSLAAAREESWSVKDFAYHDPHRFAMRGPSDFVPQHWGHVQLSRSANTSSSWREHFDRNPALRTMKAGYPVSCAFAPHLLPKSWHSSDCVGIMEKGDPVVRAVLYDPGWTDSVGPGGQRQTRWVMARPPPS